MHDELENYEASDFEFEDEEEFEDFEFRPRNAMPMGRRPAMRRSPMRPRMQRRRPVMRPAPPRRSPALRSRPIGVGGRTPLRRPRRNAGPRPAMQRPRVQPLARASTPAQIASARPAPSVASPVRSVSVRYSGYGYPAPAIPYPVPFPVPSSNGRDHAADDGATLDPNALVDMSDDNAASALPDTGADASPDTGADFTPDAAATQEPEPGDGLTPNTAPPSGTDFGDDAAPPPEEEFEAFAQKKAPTRRSHYSKPVCLQGEARVIDQFQHNQSNLLPPHQAKIRALVDFVLASWRTSQPVFEIHVEGHTDSSGTREYNRGLGCRRANIVGEEIRKAIAQLAGQQRINPPMGLSMTLGSSGESRPVGSNSMSSGRAKNRRVEVFLRYAR